jgi:hypothetical protein
LSRDVPPRLDWKRFGSLDAGVTVRDLRLRVKGNGSRVKG